MKTGKKFNDVIWLVIIVMSITFILHKLIMLNSHDEILSTLFNISENSLAVNILENIITAFCLFYYSTIG